MINKLLKEYDRDNIFTKVLIVGHGHKHFPKFSHSHCYMIDHNPKCQPDYVCDATDANQMSYLPDAHFDIIITANFPVSSDYILMLKNIKRLLKPSGELRLKELPHLFFWLVNDSVFDLIWDIYFEQISIKDILDYIRHCHRLEIQVGIRTLYRCMMIDILFGGFKCPSYDFSTYTKTISLVITRAIVDKIGFKIVSQSDRYLVLNTL